MPFPRGSVCNILGLSDHLGEDEVPWYILLSLADPDWKCFPCFWA